MQTDKWEKLWHLISVCHQKVEKDAGSSSHKPRIMGFFFLWYNKDFTLYYHGNQGLAKTANPVIGAPMFQSWDHTCGGDVKVLLNPWTAPDAASPPFQGFIAPGELEAPAGASGWGVCAEVKIG